MNATGSPAKHRPSYSSTPSSSSIISIPLSLRQLFDRFPLRIHDENVLPQRTHGQRTHHVFHMFSFENESLSANPVCLKWQAYLLIQGILFDAVSSNNHASPTGVLPFVVPAQQKKDIQPQAIASSKIQRWVENQTTNGDLGPSSLDPFTALIDSNLRTAWLYTLYIQPQNFQSVANALYVSPPSTNSFVRSALSHQLRGAAQDEILKTRTHVDEDEIYAAADAALAALATKLGSNSFFTQAHSPGLFDAALFSYTHLILRFSTGERDCEPTWKDERLLNILLKYQPLVDHRNRMLRKCSSSKT